MIVKQAVDPNKLRGGYYTDDRIVGHCINKVREHFGGWPLRWLEPSAGDGAFLRGLDRLLPRGSVRSRQQIHAFELVPAEARKARAVLAQSSLAGTVTPGSFFDSVEELPSDIDALVGNPPFVRYQFVPESDRAAAERLLGANGVTLQGVSNLWIPFALLALARLRIGGAFALVLPSEMLCTLSGGQVREYLIRHFSGVTVDLFPRGTFPEILQDVVVVSGRRAARESDVRPVGFIEHSKAGITGWTPRVQATGESWTRYLLTEHEQEAYREAATLSGFVGLGSVAKLEVAIVTGANQFFTVSDETLAEFDLQAWALPLLARTSDAPGVVFTSNDHCQARSQGARSWLLCFSGDRPSPTSRTKPSKYLAMGEATGIPDRYKCRIRDPWYRVPHVKRGAVMLTKRAHHYHRLLLNRARSFTTDTIYRGDLRAPYVGRETDLVASFQNTLTLLSSELEGRTYGGGVLELVPSEVARLRVPLLATNGLLAKVDRLSRTVDGQRDAGHCVMQLTDEFLSRRIPGYSELLPFLDSARCRLKARRQNLPAE